MATTTTSNKPASPRLSGDKKHLNKNELPLSETDPKAARQKAAENKLQLLGTLQAMKQGKMPHNAHLEELLDKLINNQVIKSREHLMSQDGKILLNDFRKLLKTVKKTLDVKNREELFQSLVYHLHLMESPITKDQLNQSAKATDKNTATSEGKKASDAMLKIGKLMLLNNEFRSVLGELIDISQDIFNSVASKAGDSLSQAGSGLKNDENHPDRNGKHLVDKLLDKALDPNKKTLPGTDNLHNNTATGEHHHGGIHDQEPHLISSPHDDPRHQGLLNTGDSVHPNAIPGGFPAGTEHQQPHLPIHQQNATIGQQTGAAQQSNIPTRVDPLQQHQHQQQGIVNPETAQQLEATGNKYQQKIENHPLYQNAKNEMYAHKDHAQATFKENVPKEKQDELLERLRLALAQVQKHPEYQDAIETLVHLVKVWTSRASQVAEDVKNNAKEGDHAKQVDVREQAERELKALIECWAQGNSIDPLLHGVQDVMRDMQNDQHLREFYHNVMQYVDRLLREPGFAQQDRSTEEGKRLMDRGNEIVKGRYREHLNYLSTESRKLMNLMANDEMSKELNHRVATIHRDLWMDNEGNPAFKPQLLNDMRMTLLPAFIDEIKYIPIPRIEYSDPQYDIVIENLIISGDTLLPNIFETKAEAFNSFSLRSEIETQPSRQSIYLRMSEIQAEIDDVVFFYKKKTGFPKLSDRGVASLSVGGKGITIALRVHSVTDNPAMTFKVSSCKANVDNLKVKVNDSKHDILYKTIRPLLTGIIRKQIARAIETKITELISQADQKVTQSIVQMNQNLQNKAYEALPEEEKARVKPAELSQARSRPGLFSTLVKILNNNIKTKVQKRNEAKRMERMSQDSNSINSKTQVEGSGQLNQHGDRHHIGDHHHHTGEHHHTAGEHHLPGSNHLNHHQGQPGYPASNAASVETDRHHFIASPPLSPTSAHKMAEQQAAPHHQGVHQQGVPQQHGLPEHQNLNQQHILPQQGLNQQHGLPQQQQGINQQGLNQGVPQQQGLGHQELLQQTQL